mgnify:CR=1 FL=1|jgi:hypothetical protein
MTLETLIISIIVFLSLISIFLGVLNWFQLASTSSQISILEDEMEKKTKEFDTLKKDRQPLQQRSFLQGAQRGNMDNSLQSSLPEAQNPPIEVVRNVGSGFQSINAFSGNGTPSEISPIDGNQSTDVLDIVEQGFPQASRERDVRAGIEIALSSSTKKDPDFSSAWKKLVAQLPLAPNSHVIVDFKNIMFLYEKELRYLEKIRDIVEKERGTIVFVNCHPELKTLIAAHPALARFIKQP